MIVRFATCVIPEAIRFLQTGYPKKNLQPEVLPKLCDSLRRDIVRITDPAYHALAITTGKNYADEHRPILDEIQAEIEGLPDDGGQPR